MLVFFLYTLAVIEGAGYRYINFEDSTFGGVNPIGNVQLVSDPPFSVGNPYGLRRQNHGVISLRVSSGVVPSFFHVTVPNFDSEVLMIDFYLNLPAPLSAVDTLLVYRGKRLGDTVDISVYLVRDYPSQIHKLIVVDRFNTYTINDPNFFIFPDSMVHPQNWYRFQVLREGDDISIYLQTRLVKNGLKPISQSFPDLIEVGFTNPTYGSSVVLFDDFILRRPVSTNSQHPRLLFRNEHVPELQLKKNHNYPYQNGLNPKVLYDTLLSRAEYWFDLDTLVVSFGNVTYFYPFPFEFPPPIWSGILYQGYMAQMSHILSFVGFLENNLNYKIKVKEFLMGLSRWIQWEWPFYYNNEILTYMETMGFHNMFNFVVAYDLVFDVLNDYERMTIENSLIVHGIQQAYLSLTKSSLSSRPVMNNKQLVGASCGILALVVLDDFSGFAREWNAFMSVINDYLSNPTESFNVNTGEAREVIFYSQYSLLYLSLANYALQLNNHFSHLTSLGKFVGNFLPSLFAPGGKTYFSYGDNSGFYGDFNEIFPELYALFSYVFNSGIAQWLLKVNNSYNFPHGQGINGSYLYFGSFLWLKNIPPSNPSSYIPLVGVYPLSGLGYIRTGFDETNHVFIGLKSGDTYFNHNHYDNNTISIFFNGKWLIGEHPSPYNVSHTRFHNTIAVIRGQDTIYQRAGYKLGSISTNFYEDTIFSYIEGRGERSYRITYGPTGYLQSYTRRIIFVNPLRMIIVLDRVKLPSGLTGRIRSFFHSSEGVELIGPLTFRISGGDNSYLIGRLYSQTPHLMTLENLNNLRRISFVSQAEINEINNYYLFKVTNTPTSELEALSLDSTGQARIMNFSNKVFIYEMLPGFQELSYSFEGANSSYHIFLNLTPNQAYYFIFITEDTMVGSLFTPSKGFASLKLPEYQGRGELRIYKFPILAENPPTYPPTQNKLAIRNSIGYFVYETKNLVLSRFYNWGLTPQEEILDFGKGPATTYLNGNYYVTYLEERHTFSSISLIKYSGTSRQKRRIYILPNDRGVLYYPSIASDTTGHVWLSFYKCSNDSILTLMIYKIEAQDLNIVSQDTQFYVKRIPNIPDPYKMESPTIFPIFGNRIVVVWGIPTWTSRVNNILLMRVMLNGGGWSSIISVSEDSTKNNFSPSLFLKGDILQVSWIEDTRTFVRSFSLSDFNWLISKTPVSQAQDICLSTKFLNDQYLILTRNLGAFGTTLSIYFFNGINWLRICDLGSPSLYRSYPQTSFRGDRIHYVLFSQRMGLSHYLVKDTILELIPRNYVYGTIYGREEWGDTVFVLGDVTIKGILNILPGTQVVVSTDFDIMKSGYDTSKIEIVVEGKMNVFSGPFISTVVFSKERGREGNWGGLYFRGEGEDTLSFVNIIDCEVGLVLEGPRRLYLNRVGINAEKIGILAKNGSAEIINSNIIAWDGVGIYAEKSGGIDVENSYIRGSFVGLLGKNLNVFSSIRNSTILGSNAGYGILLYDSYGTMNLFNNTIGNYLVGIYLLNSSPELMFNNINALRVSEISLNNSCPYHLRNVINSNIVGFVCAFGSYPFLGNENDGGFGYNRITSTQFYILNLNHGELKAEGNYWDGGIPPNPQKFFGPVDYVPYLLSGVLSDVEPAKEFFSHSERILLVFKRKHIEVRNLEKSRLFLNITIYDKLGRKIIGEEVELEGGGVDKVDIGRLSEGIYFCVYEAKGLGRKVVKFMVGD